MEVEGYVDTNGNGAYIGLTCGSYGDAAEFAVFLDEDCTVETNQLSAMTVLSGANANEDGVSLSTVLAKASTYMQEAFTTSLSCEQVTYRYNYYGNYGNNNGEVEMTEECAQITDEALYIADCNIQNNQEQQDAQDEDMWYNFDVQDAGDLEEACAVVNYKLQAGEKFEFFYDEDYQGTVGYERDYKGELKNLEDAALAMGPGMIGLIVALVIGVVVAPIAWMVRARHNSTEPAVEMQYQGGKLS